MKSMIKTLAILVAAMSMSSGTFAQANAAPWCSSGKPIRFAEVGWDSGKFYTELIRAIVERGYGCKTETFPGANPITQAALLNGGLEFWVEYWQGRTESLEAAAKEGKIKIVGELVAGGGVEGFYVPEYIIKGDAARGIKPVAPDLKSVSDLLKYKTLFKDDEDPSKGRIFNCPTGWSCEKDNNQRMKAYGLNGAFNNFRPGTGAALDSAIASAFQRGQPIVFSYWAPSSILGKYKSVRLEEPAWAEKCWKTINGSATDTPCGSASPATNLSVAVSSTFAKSDPAIVTVASNVKLPMSVINETIAEMSEKKIGADKMAIEFLRKRDDLWKKWVPEAIATKIESSLK